MARSQAAREDAGAAARCFGEEEGDVICHVDLFSLHREAGGDKLWLDELAPRAAVVIIMAAVAMAIAVVALTVIIASMIGHVGSLSCVGFWGEVGRIWTLKGGTRHKGKPEGR